jgi:5-methylcytosine-specific restriction endonuclease McrA
MRKFYDDLIKLNPNPTYSQLLSTADWDIKRHEIFKRDNYICQNCGTPQTNRLTVHHKKYLTNRLPWEYDNDDLITLCDECHAKEHDILPYGIRASSHVKRIPKTWL